MKTADSIVSRFERIAALHPDRIALHSGARRLSYRELNEEGDRIARALAAAASGPVPGRVALLFAQSVEGIVSTIGTLKSGGVFVPLDAADGSERMRRVIADCQPQVILTTVEMRDLAESLAGGDPCILCVDALPNETPAEIPEMVIEPDRDAYIFYTSGSTGTPKGVRQTHRNLLHFIDVYSRTLGITESDRLSLLYSPAFSASNMDLFGALLNGATLFPYDIRRHGTARLGDWLDENRITVLHAVPTVYRNLAAQLPTGRVLGTVRAVDLGGEAVHPSDLALHREHFSADCFLVNHLAATEASVIAQYRVERDREDYGDILPVGPPAEGMEIRIVGDDGRPVRDGESGEIILSSPYISPGYWNRPDLDRDSFGSDASRPGWRTYRTGDLGHFTPDGSLHFQGRKGRRVKVRGHTVDVSEIESAILAIPGIRDVAVILRESQPEGEAGQLVAFLEGPASLNRRLRELKLMLRGQMPPYMIPAEMVILESLPATASGKVDRRALSRIESREHHEENHCDFPLGETEEAIAELFSKVLRREFVGRSEDFFLSGGDSLKATLLHGLMETRFAKRIPLEELFLDPTVRGAAELIARTGEEGSRIPPVLVPLRRSGAKPALFLVHGAEGQAFVSPRFLSILGEEQPVYALQATGLDRDRIPCNTVGEMAAEYVSAIRSIQPRGPYLIGALCTGGLIAVEMAIQLREAGESTGPLVLFDPPAIPPGDRAAWKRVGKRIMVGCRKRLNVYQTDRKFFDTVRKYAQEGKIRLDPDDLNAVRDAQRVAVDFKLAMLKYRLSEYSGPVYILGTSDRLGKASVPGAIPNTWHERLRGDLRVFNVGQKHGEVHDVENALFVRKTREVMSLVDEYFAVQSRDPTNSV